MLSERDAPILMARSGSSQKMTEVKSDEWGSGFKSEVGGWGRVSQNKLDLSRYLRNLWILPLKRTLSLSWGPLSPGCLWFV